MLNNSMCRINYWGLKYIWLVIYVWEAKLRLAICIHWVPLVVIILLPDMLESWTQGGVNRGRMNSDTRGKGFKMTRTLASSIIHIAAVFERF